MSAKHRMTQKQLDNSLRHLLNVALVAGLEVFDKRPMVDNCDVEVWCMIPGTKTMCALLARKFESGRITYGYTGTVQEQDAMSHYMTAHSTALTLLSNGPV